MISVIIPNYNHGIYLTEAIGSILNQSYNDFEIIVADDGSTDNSTDIIRNMMLMDKRLKLIELKKNCGMVTAINTGIKASRGEYFFGLSADDYVISNNFFSDAISSFDKNKCSGFFGKTEVIDPINQKRIGVLGSADRTGLLDKNFIIRNFLNSKIFIPGSSSIWKMDDLRRLELFDENLGPQADFFLNHIIAMRGNAYFSDKIYTRMRRFENSFGNNINTNRYLRSHAKLADMIMEDNPEVSEAHLKIWKLRIIENVLPEKRVLKILKRLKSITDDKMVKKLPNELQTLLNEIKIYEHKFLEEIKVAKDILRLSI
jgi:glycosyltransferase involved in cell wall biosynthesis